MKDEVVFRNKKYDVEIVNEDFAGYNMEFVEAAYYYAKVDKHNMNQKWSIYRVLSEDYMIVGLGTMDDRGTVYIYNDTKAIFKDNFKHMEIVAKIQRKSNGVFEVTDIYGDTIAIIKEVDA